jgi:hypothetical protein
MADGQGSPHPRRGASPFRDGGLDWTLALCAVAIGVVIYLLDDRTNWSAGFGFDGRFYGELAKNFPSAVFGHSVVIPPGLGHYTGPTLHGVDSYYAYRWVPSGLVWLGLKALGLSSSNGHVIGLFAGMNALMFGLATFCWCRSAGLLGLTDREKLLGTIALLVSFAVLKTGGYYPVATDQVALGLGALGLYLWLRGSTLLLALCVIVACFAWPFNLIVGPLLLLFPPPAGVGGMFAPGKETRSAGWPGPSAIAVGAFAGLAAIVFLTVVQLDGYRSLLGTEQLPAFPLSAAITGIYVFAVVSLFFPPGGFAALLPIVRSIQARRLALALGTIAIVLVAAHSIAQRPGFAVSDLSKNAFWSTTLDPGLFGVVFVGYFGPLLLLLFADLPRAAGDAWRLGPAMAVVVALALGGALATQPREIIDMLPFLLIPGVLAARRLIGLSTAAILVFLGLSLVLSRIWLPIGAISTDLSKLQQFPAQGYYMATGAWTSPSMYAAQLAAVALAGAALWLVARSRRSATSAEPS